MALILRDTVNPQKKYKLELLSFNEEDSLFNLSSKDKSKQIVVEYIPFIQRDFEEKNFELFFFSNPYLNAENDVFEIFENKMDTRIGWLFPIQVLESNEGDYAGNEFLNRYKFPAFKALLEGEQTREVEYDSRDYYKITDFFHDDICVFVLCHDALPKNKNFQIVDYLPSFGNFGYYSWRDVDHKIFVEKKPLILKYRDKTSLRIQESNLSYSESDFLESLYKIHLIGLDHFLLKFIFLYQVIEYLLEITFDREFINLLKQYESNTITKNEIKSSFNELNNERTRINLLLNSVEGKISQDVRNEFKTDSKLFISKFISTERENLGNQIYDIRNLVTHNYHRILKEEEAIKLLDSITHKLELIVNDILIYYPFKQSNNTKDRISFLKKLKVIISKIFSLVQELSVK